MPTRLSALFRSRCPHCLQGEIFSGFWRMHETCPVCGVTFERETGYFMNAIFFGYLLGFLAVLPVSIALYLLSAPASWFLVGISATLVLLSPLIFRYARVLWMHLDEVLDPR